MDINFLPNITVIPINNRKNNSKALKKNIKVKGKAISIRASRNSEPGKAIITIITDTNENNIKELLNSDVVISNT